MSNRNDALVERLKSFFDVVGHKVRRKMCPLYVTGLLVPGEHKSMEPIAASLFATMWNAREKENTSKDIFV